MEYEESDDIRVPGNKLFSRVYGEGKLYENRGGETSYRVDESDASAEWMLESVYMEEGTLDKKKVRSLQFNIELEEDAYFAVYVRYDNEVTWRREASITADKRNTYLVPVKLKRCERYQYRLEGRGVFTLYGMSKTIGKGSER